MATIGLRALGFTAASRTSSWLSCSVSAATSNPVAPADASPGAGSFDGGSAVGRAFFLALVFFG